jgi:hypothetical protein
MNYPLTLSKRTSALRLRFLFVILLVILLAGCSSSTGAVLGLLPGDADSKAQASAVVAHQLPQSDNATARAALSREGAQEIVPAAEKKDTEQKK